MTSRPGRPRSGLPPIAPVLLAALAAATLGPACAALAAERVPFAGAWSCAQLVDNEAVGDWWPERYAEDGGPLADARARRRPARPAA